jgi:hypothetical protein
MCRSAFSSGTLIPEESVFLDQPGRYCGYKGFPTVIAGTYLCQNFGGSCLQSRDVEVSNHYYEVVISKVLEEMLEFRFDVQVFGAQDFA